MVLYNERMQALDFSADIQLLNQHNADLVIGIDEVGRGAWAGPVCIGAFVLDINSFKLIDGINDSKLVPKQKRQELSSLLQPTNHLVLTGSLEDINQVGIGQTISQLITSAISQLYESLMQQNKRAVYIIDGQFKTDFGNQTVKQNKADSTFYSVAAASILAKVYRDELMSQLHLSYNHYGFDRNKGYPTKEHLNALKIYGASQIHRTSFKPILSYEKNRN